MKETPLRSAFIFPTHKPSKQVFTLPLSGWFDVEETVPHCRKPNHLYIRKEEMYRQWEPSRISWVYRVHVVVSGYDPQRWNQDVTCVAKCVLFVGGLWEWGKSRIMITNGCWYVVLLFKKQNAICKMRGCEKKRKISTYLHHFLQDRICCLQRDGVPCHFSQVWSKEAWALDSVDGRV